MRRVVLAMTAHTIYRVWYSSEALPDERTCDRLVYIGRTNQDLTARMRGHFLASPMHRVLDISRVSRVDYTTFATEADMYVAEIVLINRHKPTLNRDDKAADALTLEIDLRVDGWRVWEKPHLVEKWSQDRRARRPLSPEPLTVPA